MVYVKVGDAEDVSAAVGEPMLVDPNEFSCEVLCKETDVVCSVSEPACQEAIFIVIDTFLAEGGGGEGGGRGELGCACDCAKLMVRGGACVFNTYI
jgi:hypothetical protein